MGDFIKRLQEVIGEKHGDKTRFARKAGINRQDLDQYLAGYMPGADKLHKLAKACGKSMEWLLTGEEPKQEINFAEAKGPRYGEGAWQKAQQIPKLQELNNLVLSLPPDKQEILLESVLNLARAMTKEQK